MNEWMSLYWKWSGLSSVAEIKIIKRRDQIFSSGFINCWLAGNKQHPFIIVSHGCDGSGGRGWPTSIKIRLSRDGDNHTLQFLPVNNVKVVKYQLSPKSVLFIGPFRNTPRCHVLLMEDCIRTQKANRSVDQYPWTLNREVTIPIKSRRLLHVYAMRWVVNDFMDLLINSI